MPFVLQFAKSRNMVVRPNKCTSHQGAVPNIGGVNIFLSLLVVFIPLVVSGNMKFSLFVGFCIIFVIGFIDDRLVLSAYWKIGGETLCAFFLIYFADIRITSLSGILGIYELHPLLSYALSYLCYILVINALNLIDVVLAMVSQGLGYALLPELAVHSGFVPDGVVVSSLPGLGTRQLVVRHRVTRTEPTSAVRAVLEALLSH